MNRKIGVYCKGGRRITVKWRPGSGASILGDDVNIMEIGFDQPRWDYILSSLMHECFEIFCIDIELAYSHVFTIGNSSSEGLFVMTHEQMYEAIARTAHFVSACQLDVRKAWDRYNREKKK